MNIESKTYSVHRLVCRAFHGLPPSEAHAKVNHKDGDKSNNKLDNLEWCTRDENIQHEHKLLDRKSNAGARSKPVRGRRVGTEE